MRESKNLAQQTLLDVGMAMRADGVPLLLRLEAVASLLCPGGKRVTVVSLVEFPSKGRSAKSHEPA